MSNFYILLFAACSTAAPNEENPHWKFSKSKTQDDSNRSQIGKSGECDTFFLVTVVCSRCHLNVAVCIDSIRIDLSKMNHMDVDEKAPRSGFANLRRPDAVPATQIARRDDVFVHLHFPRPRRRSVQRATTSRCGRLRLPNTSKI